MALEVLVNGSADPRARYLSWAPSPGRIRQTGGAANVTVTLRNKPAPGGGEIEFYAALPGDPAPTLDLTLPADGTPVDFWVAGRFPRASSDDGDTALEVVQGGAVALSLPLMVRIRKNANLLDDGERERFLAAFAKLNDAGMGPFVNFRNMHTAAGDPEAHRAAGFLPWHRAYLLDLERELQAIDRSVALPYWRFDQPAPLLFDLDFIGVSDDSGTVHFSQDNPLQFWVTDGMPGIQRRPRFNTSTEPADVISEADTLALGGPNNLFAAFRSMEGDPHGSAHVSFGGSISSISTAARDPLFFLLHCNVDRLWAKWQWFFGRWDASQPGSYDPRPQRVGHNLNDTMWPWNGVTTPPRPSTAPGGGLASSLMTPAPGAKPRVRDLLDLQGKVTAAGRLGCDYDDVPFE